MTSLRAEGLVKSYGNRTVVNGVSFSVSPGEIVGLLGQNGAGKTTSFYMVVGLVRPENGSVWLDDHDITRMPMYKRARLGVGYLAQEPSAFRKLTVEENILLVLEQANLTKAERTSRLETLLADLNLEPRRHNMAQVLSGGERRRVEIARVLAMAPKFVLLDEPFTGIDPVLVEDLQQIITRLRSRNIGVLITDHNVHATLEITDRAYIISEGEIRTSGTSHDLVNDPVARKYYLGESTAGTILAAAARRASAANGQDNGS